MTGRGKRDKYDAIVDRFGAMAEKGKTARAQYQDGAVRRLCSHGGGLGSIKSYYVQVRTVVGPSLASAHRGEAKRITFGDRN